MRAVRRPGEGDDVPGEVVPEVPRAVALMLPGAPVPDLKLAVLIPHVPAAGRDLGTIRRPGGREPVHGRRRAVDPRDAGDVVRLRRRLLLRGLLPPRPVDHEPLKPVVVVVVAHWLPPPAPCRPRLPDGSWRRHGPRIVPDHTHRARRSDRGRSAGHDRALTAVLADLG